MDKSTSNAQLAVTAEPAPLTPGGNGSALFVINLCASIAPTRIDGNNIPGLENYRLYQVARVEDGRTRHRLRLGFFTSESHAESVLTVVRQQYPTAFTACLCEEDRRFARGYLPQTPAAPPRPVAKPTPAAAKTLAAAEPEVIELTWEPQAPVAAPVAKPEAKAAAAAPTAALAAAKQSDALDDFTWEPPSLTPAAASAIARTTAVPTTSDTARHPTLKIAAKQPEKPAAPAAKPTAPTPAAPVAAAASRPDPGSSMRVRALELTMSDPPPPTVAAQRQAPAEPFHVGKGVEFKDVGISLEKETVEKTLAKPVATPAPKVPEKLAKAPAPVAAPVKPAAVAKPASAPAVPPPIRVMTSPNAPLPELDSTQTIRALTSAEMEDEAQEKWFAVQLAVSEQAMNIDAMPRLDIFEAYRLYSIATAGSGKIVHSLRLGFFKEAVSAEAVSGYLKTFFGTPTVMRVSVAEHARFKDAPTAKKPAAAAHEAKVVELNNARAARPVVPTVTMEVAPRVDTAATGSFRPLDTGSFKKSASGTHKALSTGTHKALATGTHKALSTGSHKALKNAAKSAGPSTKRARVKTGNTGKHKALPVERKSLAQQLLDEAREVELSESGIRKLPKNDSLLSRMFGKLTK